MKVYFALSKIINRSPKREFSVTLLLKDAIESDSHISEKIQNSSHMPFCWINLTRHTLRSPSGGNTTSGLYKNMFPRPGFQNLVFAFLRAKPMLSKPPNTAFSPHFLKTETPLPRMRSTSGQYHKVVRNPFFSPHSSEEKQHSSDFERIGTAVPVWTTTVRLFVLRDQSTKGTF